MGVMLGFIILLVCMTQAKILVPKCDQAAKRINGLPDWIEPDPDKNKNCEALADNFCDKSGQKSCNNFRTYCAKLLNNADSLRGVSVDVEEVWDFTFDMLDRYLPTLGGGIVPAPIAAIHSNGTKRSDPEDNCPSEVCPVVFKPVCGGLLYFFARRSYLSECDMKHAACLHRKPIIKVKDGEC